MKTLQITTLCLLFLLFGCETKSLIDDSTIAKEIIFEVKGSSGNLYFTEDKLVNNNKEKYFVEFNVNDSELIHKHKTEKKLVASYCATQLYKRLNPKTIEKNYGFNIIFDNEEDLSNPKKYFFEKAETRQAVKAFNTIDKYLNSIISGDTLSAIALIDTNYFVLNINKINDSIKRKINQPIVNTYHFYNHYEYENRAGTKKVSCFDITTVITSENNEQTLIDFLIPINEAENKIINLNIDPRTR